jgi:hypothetical protein
LSWVRAKQTFAGRIGPGVPAAQLVSRVRANACNGEIRIPNQYAKAFQSTEMRRRVNAVDQGLGFVRILQAEVGPAAAEWAES